MVAFRISYTPGIFHEAPWIRAKQQEVEWPPSPFAILGVIVAGWARIGDVGVDRLLSICDRLARPPKFDLPPATFGHRRHYAPQPDSPEPRAITSPVLDAFVPRREGNASVSTFVIWPDVDLDADDLRLLDRILSATNTLSHKPCTFSVAASLPVELDRIHVLVASPTDGFFGPLVRRVAARPEVRGLPLFKALIRDLTSSASADRSQPNETTLVDYRFPPQFGLDEEDIFARERARAELPPRIERFVLAASAGSPLPLVTETIVLAEAMRWATMRASSARELRVADPVLSGKAPSGEPSQGHGHAFFLPRDLDGDGRLDHLDIWYPSGSSVNTHRSSLAARILYDHRMRCRVYLEHIGPAARPVGTVWKSATPFVLERHVKAAGRGSSIIKSDGPIDQVRASLRNHGFADATTRIELREDRPVSASPEGDPIHALSFRRSRQKESHAMAAYAVELCFADAVEGPIVIGRHAHFGLGQFVPIL